MSPTRLYYFLFIMDTEGHFDIRHPGSFFLSLLGLRINRILQPNDFIVSNVIMSMMRTLPPEITNRRHKCYPIYMVESPSSPTKGSNCFDTTTTGTKVYCYTIFTRNIKFTFLQYLGYQNYKFWFNLKYLHIIIVKNFYRVSLILKNMRSIIIPSTIQKKYLPYIHNKSYQPTTYYLMGIKILKIPYLYPSPLIQ